MEQGRYAQGRVDRGAAGPAGVLSGCASQGLLSGDTPGLSGKFHRHGGFPGGISPRRRKCVRVCHEQRPHPYGVVYQSSRRLGDRGAPNEVHVFKREEPTKILEIIQSQTETPSTARVTVRVLGDGGGCGGDRRGQGLDSVRHAGVQAGRRLIWVRGADYRPGDNGQGLLAGPLRLLAGSMAWQR